MNTRDCIKVEDNLEGVPYETPDVVYVPDKYVDGVHTRQFMPKSEFPIKIKVLSTGLIYEVHGFNKECAIYTGVFKMDGAFFAHNGVFNGEYGKDFVFV